MAPRVQDLQLQLLTVRAVVLTRRPVDAKLTRWRGCAPAMDTGIHALRPADRSCVRPWWTRYRRDRLIRGDDLASLRLGHEEHLGDVIAGEGTDVEVDVGASLRSLSVHRCELWKLTVSGFGPPRVPPPPEKSNVRVTTALSRLSQSPVLERWLASSQSVGEQQGTVRRAEPCE